MTLPYRADWSSGPAGWGLTSGWTVRDGMLVSDGASWSEAAGASSPMEVDEAAFAVEAEIRMDQYTDGGERGGRASFGVMARIQRDGNGYGAGHCYSLGRYVPVCAGGKQGVHRSVLWASDRATIAFEQLHSDRTLTATRWAADTPTQRVTGRTRTARLLAPTSSTPSLRSRR